MAILVFLIILAVLVLSHEFGHFITAKMFGIRVDEFGFGFPPKIFSFKYGETTYSINLLPFGGFVKIFGEDPTQDVLDKDHKDVKRSLYRKPRYIQAAVIVAGVFFNLILGWVMLSGGFMSGLPVPAGFTSLGPKPEESKLLITEVLKDSPADLAGLRAGYNITYLATKDASVQNITPEEVSSFIAIHNEEKVYIGYKTPVNKNMLSSIGLGPLDYNIETNTAIVIPKMGVIGDRPGIGISMDLVGVLKLPFLKSLYAGILGTVSLFLGTASGLFSFVTGIFTGGSSAVSVSGPIGLVGVVGEAAGFGLPYILALTALISVNLAVLNLVPFPALDGGRLLFLLIESIRRKPLNSKVVNALNIGGFLILLGLMLIVTVGDIFRLTN
jgi:regulator of sigma E protease